MVTETQPQAFCRREPEERAGDGWGGSSVSFSLQFQDGIGRRRVRGSTRDRSGRADRMSAVLGVARRQDWACISGWGGGVQMRGRRGEATGYNLDVDSAGTTYEHIYAGSNRRGLRRGGAGRLGGEGGGRWEARRTSPASVSGERRSVHRVRDLAARRSEGEGESVCGYACVASFMS